MQELVSHYTNSLFHHPSSSSSSSPLSSTTSSLSYPVGLLLYLITLRATTEAGHPWAYLSQSNHYFDKVVWGCLINCTNDPSTNINDLQCAWLYPLPCALASLLCHFADFLKFPPTSLCCNHFERHNLTRNIDWNAPRPFRLMHFWGGSISFLASCKKKRQKKNTMSPNTCLYHAYYVCFILTPHKKTTSHNLAP